MENKALIQEFTDKIIKDDETSGASIKSVIVSKTKDLVKNWKEQAAFSSVFEGVLDGGPFEMRGNDVLINGKVVGHIKYDLNDEDGGINFVSEDKSYSREFDTVESLFAYLAHKFNVKENNEKSLGTKIEEPKKLDHGSEEKKKMAQPGAEHTDVDGKANADKKGETKDKFEPDAESGQAAGSRFTKLKGIIASIKSGGRPTSTAVTENKANWSADNAEVEGAGKEAKIKAKIKKIKAKADKQGNE